MYNHYIRINDKNDIIKAFSNDFENPEENDICINENTNERFFKLDLFFDEDIYKYKWENDSIVEKTLQQVEDERNSLERKLIKLRQIRDDLLSKTIWIMQRHYGEITGLELSITIKPTTLTEEEFKSWLLYWEKLRDLPETTNLEAITIDQIMSVFPEMPVIK